MKLSNFEKIIGYTFKDAALLERALTHRSWAHENLAGRSEDEIRAAENESFEFLGDSILGLAVAEQLFLKYPDASEGELTLMKHRLVSTSTLADAAESLKLGEHIRIGRGEEKTGGRQKRAILADALEAVIAAVFFDSGYIATRAFVTRILASEFRVVTPEGSADYKTLLQEKLQAEQLSAPVYSLVRSEGQPHERTFYVEASWNTGRAEGTGRSIKSAEMMAASEALRSLQTQGAESAKRKV
ncbi:MAG: ribonuclease III [Pyrinomonadaceae bacterium]